MMLPSEFMNRNPVRELDNSLSKRWKDIGQNSETMISEFSLAEVYINSFSPLELKLIGKSL